MRLYSVYYISVGSCTCFGCWYPSSGARTTVITASGTGQPVPLLSSNSTTRADGSGTGWPLPEAVRARGDGCQHPKYVRCLQICNKLNTVASCWTIIQFDINLLWEAEEKDESLSWLHTIWSGFKSVTFRKLPFSKSLLPQSELNQFCTGKPLLHRSKTTIIQCLKSLRPIPPLYLKAPDIIDCRVNYIRYSSFDSSLTEHRRTMFLELFGRKK